MNRKDKSIYYFALKELKPLFAQIVENQILLTKSIKLLCDYLRKTI